MNIAAVEPQAVKTHKTRESHSVEANRFLRQITPQSNRCGEP